VNVEGEKLKICTSPHAARVPIRCRRKVWQEIRTSIAASPMIPSIGRGGKPEEALRRKLPIQHQEKYKSQENRSADQNFPVLFIPGH
jgi:hypothetical protein